MGAGSSFSVMRMFSIDCGGRHNRAHTKNHGVVYTMLVNCLGEYLRKTYPPNISIRNHKKVLPSYP